MKKQRKTGSQEEAWRQPYIDAFNKSAGFPPGLPFLHHNMKAMEDAAKAARERPAGTIAVTKTSSSRPGGSVARARAIFDELKGKSRTEMMAACDKAGINKGTAATQYGRWKKEQAK